jgi:Tol biopolymer transport system component
MCPASLFAESFGTGDAPRVFIDSLFIFRNLLVILNNSLSRSISRNVQCGMCAGIAKHLPNTNNPRGIVTMLHLMTLLLLVSVLSGCGGGSSSGGGDTAVAAVTPNYRPVVYIADADTDGINELYLADAATPGAAVKLNAALVAGGNVTDYLVNPEGTRVLYRADQDTDDVFELYLVDLAVPGVATKINGLLVGGGDVTNEFLFSPDGTQVVYRADEHVNELFELFVVNLAAPGFVANLSGPLAGGRDVLPGFAFTPDGTRVIYYADELTDNVNELFMVDITLPGVSTVLSAPLVGGGDVNQGFIVTPDSTQVIYRADQTVDNLVELYLVDLATPGVSMTLSSPLVAGGDVSTGFIISPDGSLVAYLADQDSNDVFELYVVDIATPGISTRINRNPTSGGDVLQSGFRFSPDSRALAYVADEDTNNLVEFFLVELASPAVSIKLNSPLVAGGDITPDFAFTPEGTALIYVADQDTDEVFELYRVERATPGTTVKLNAPLVAGGNVQSPGFEQSDDGMNLFYIADQAVDEDFELFVVDLATPGAATEVGFPPIAGGDVLEFSVIQ